MNLFWEIIGSMAAMLTSLSFIPQIVRVHKHKSAKDVSPVTLFQLSLGVSLWMAYGIYLKNIVIIAANLVTLLTLVILIFLYFSYGRNK